MISNKTIISPIWKFLGILLVFLSQQSLAGGPWIQEKGQGYGQVSFTFIPAYNSLYGSDGKTIKLNREVTDRTLQGYGEYGLTPRLTVTGELPLKFVSTAAEVLAGSDFQENVLESGSLTGLGNISVALKYALLQKRLLLSGQLKIDAPTATGEANTGLRTGTGAWGLAPTLILGGSHGKFYAFIESGVRFRSNDYSREFLLGGEAGVSLFSRIWLIGVLDVRQSIDDGTHDNENSEQTGLYPDNQEYVAFGLKLIAEINRRFGINLSAFGASGGNLVAKSPANTLGVYLRW
jgi:hypothetical protein